MVDEEHPLHSELQKRIEIAQNKSQIRRGTLGPENFSRKDLAIDAFAAAYCPRDRVGDDIQRQLDRVERSAAFHQNSKQQQTDNLIHQLLSGAKLLDHKLRKALGFPRESFTLKPRNSLFIHKLLPLINPGGLVAITEGIYDIDTTLSVGTRIGIMGYNDATQLNQTDDIDYVFETKSGQLNWRNIFEQFYVNGNRESRTKGTAIHLRNCQHAEVRSLSIQDMKDHAVYMSGTETYQTLGCHIHYNYMRDCLDDFVTNGSETYDLLAEHNIIGGFENIGIGFVLSWDTHAIIHHNHMWRVKRGVHALFAHQSKISCNMIDSPHEIGIVVQNSENVTVEDNTVKHACWDTEEYDTGILVVGTIFPEEGGSQYYSDSCMVIGNKIFSVIDNPIGASKAKFGILIGDYARYAFVDANHIKLDPTYQDSLWDIWVTGTGTTGTLFGINYARCPSNDYKELNYLNIDLITSLLAGSGGIAAGDLVSLSGDNTVIKATFANSMKGVGVAVETAAQGVTAKILRHGRIKVVASGTVTAGDLITASSSVAGRAMTVPTTSYQITTSEAPAHSHSCSSEGSHVHVIDGVGDHSHGGTTGAGGSHYHTTDSGGSHSHGGATGSGTAHAHTIYYTPQSTSENGDPAHTHTYYLRDATTQNESSHSHTISSDGSHYHTTGDSVPSTHSHSITADGNHTHTMQYNANHSHTIGLNGAHNHTVSVPAGKVFGKAVTSAASAGKTFDLLVGVLT